MSWRAAVVGDDMVWEGGWCGDGGDEEVVGVVRGQQ